MKLFFSDSVKRIPGEVRAMKGMTGELLEKVEDKLDTLTAKMDLLERDNRVLRQNQSLVTVRLSRYLPVDSTYGLELLFKVIVNIIPDIDFVPF